MGAIVKSGRFVPGVTGNGNGGRPIVALRELRAEIQRRATQGNDTHQLISWLWELAEGQIVEHPDEGPVSLTPAAARLKAIELLLAYGYGKPKEETPDEQDGIAAPTVAGIDIGKLTEDERATFALLVLKVGAKS